MYATMQLTILKISQLGKNYSLYMFIYYISFYINFFNAKHIYKPPVPSLTHSLTLPSGCHDIGNLLYIIYLYEVHRTFGHLFLNIIPLLLFPNN